MLKVSHLETLKSIKTIQQTCYKTGLSYAVFMTFRQRLKKRRKELRLTGTGLGLALDPPISKQSISHWEAGRTHPDIYQVAQLCKILHISADALLLGEALIFSAKAAELAAMFDALPPESQRHWAPILSTMAQATPKDQQARLRPTRLTGLVTIQMASDDTKTYKKVVSDAECDPVSNAKKKPK